MTSIRTIALLAIIVQSAFMTMPERPGYASHASYVVQPIYFFSSDMSNDFTTYQSRLNSFMSVTNSWYATTHLSTGDNFQMNAITWRQGNRTKAQYCAPEPVSTCTISHVFTKVWDDLRTGNISPSPLGYNPDAAKNVVTVVFFDNVGSSSGPWGLGLSKGAAVGSYDPEGYGGIVMVNGWIMDQSASSGYVGTVAHEIGHALRMPHNDALGGSCRLMKSGVYDINCWAAGTSLLVNGQGSNGYWYLEQFATHFSPFTRISGATSPPTNLSAVQTVCGSLRFNWSLVSGDSTSSVVLLVAPMGTKYSYDGSAVQIEVDNIYYNINRLTVTLPSSATQYTATGLTPGVYHWAVAPVNAAGHVHGWPDAHGVSLTC